MSEMAEMAETPSTENQQQAASLPDDPQQRHEGLKLDLMTGSANQPLADLRLAAMEYLRSMTPSGKDQAAAAPKQNRWVQMGPMAIPWGQTYSNARVLVTGRVTAIVVDPTDSNCIYVGTALGGVWKTKNDGKTWVPMSDNEDSLAIGALAMDPSNHLVLYAGTGEGNFSGDSYYGAGVLKTTNGGASWTLQGANTFTRARFSRIAVDPKTPSTIFAATGNGLYRSMDGGESWEQLKSDVLPAWQATDVIIDSSTPGTVYAAFWSAGIYRTTDADNATPTWTKLAGGLPTGGFTRIALGISPSSPKTLYALIANTPSLSYIIDQFYSTTDGGDSWSRTPLPNGNLGGQGFYNLNVAVDLATPDIVYLSAISLWKASRNTTGDWSFTNIGMAFHPDNHTIAFDPKNLQVLYAGSDGGIYTSKDGGATWSDAINKGLCITQFEFMEQHPHSDAVVFAGTQDNGTEQFRNSPVFYHAYDGDGGYVAIDHNEPNNVICTYIYLTPKRSTEGGIFGSWTDVSRGLSGSALFYSPLALDASHPNNVAMGADKVFLDPAQGNGGWVTSVALPGLENVSEINYVNSDLIYVGTSRGKVYRLVGSSNVWTVTELSNAQLPGQFIWDIATLPKDDHTIIVVMSGFGSPHVWRGTVPARGTGAARWTDISGTGAGRLPDIPVNVVVIDPALADTIYIGTDVGVFRTTNGGTTWEPFSSGLPGSAIFDMSLHEPTRLLRVVTHGRGMWELKLDTHNQLDVNLFVRHNLMDTGHPPSNAASTTAAFQDPLQHVALGDQLWWWECADLKIDAPEGSLQAYQMDPAQVDYVKFERELEHRNPQRGHLNRIYAQLQNRGIAPPSDVTIKLLYTGACAGLPDLPADFWEAFPGDSIEESHWKSVGPARVISSLSPYQPANLEWDWTMPITDAEHSCLLMVTDSASDPIPGANKVFKVEELISREKRVGVKNLHVVNVAPKTHYWTPFHFYGNPKLRHTITIPPSIASGWRLGILFQAGTQKALKLERVTTTRPTAAMLKALKDRIGSDIGKYDTTALYLWDNSHADASLANVVLPGVGLSAMLLLSPSQKAVANGKVSIIQKMKQDIIGGSTFVLRTTKFVLEEK